MFKSSLKYIFLVLIISTGFKAQGQQKVLGLKEAEQLALSNYGSIKAKANQLNASKAYLNETKTEQLPDVNLSAQHDYGTVNSNLGLYMATVVLVWPHRARCWPTKTGMQLSARCTWPTLTGIFSRLAKPSKGLKYNGRSCLATKPI